MAAFITWSDERRLGIDTLDNQHRLLADCINRLVDECRQAENDSPENKLKHEEVLARLIDELYATTKNHFNHEEALMRKENYPSYATHAREHLMLLAELKATVGNGLKVDCASLNQDILNSLKSWLIAHVSHSDRDFADFLLEKHRAQTTAL